MVRPPGPRTAPISDRAKYPHPSSKPADHIAEEQEFVILWRSFRGKPSPVRPRAEKFDLDRRVFVFDSSVESVGEFRLDRSGETEV